MLFGRKKYYLPKLSAVTAFITLFYLVFGPLFLSFESGLVPIAKAATVTWVAGATGTWETGSNWSSGVVPTTADDVVIASSTGNIAITLSSGQTANFNSLTIGGDATYYATTTLAGNIGTGGAITVNTKGVLEQSNFTNQTITGTLTVASGGKATHVINTQQTNTQDKGFVFTAPNFNFQAGSLLDAVGKGFNQSTCAGGYGSGYGPGASVSQVNEHSPGASHGGLGGNDDGGNVGNRYVYGDLTAPYEHGSSAGRMHFDCGGAGGGTIKLTVTDGGTATISGTVTSTGTGGPAVNGRFGGGGSGGSVWINFTSGGTFTGSGTIGAGGGTALGSVWDGGGGGGGGRIAITGHSTDSYTGTFYYAGGGNNASNNTTLATSGGSGTLYKKMSSATYGDLYVNNGSIDDFTPTQTSSTMSLANIWLNGKANLVISSSTVLTITSSTLGAATVSSTLNVNGTFVTPSTFSVPAYVQMFAAITQISSITDLTVRTNGFVEIDSLTTSSIWVLDSLNVSGILTHRSNSSTIENALMVSSTAITINSGGEISATGRGYSGAIGANNGNGPGKGRISGGYGGGGGYGGAGGRGNNTSAFGGAIYGSTSTPEYEAGSGGAGGFDSDSHYGGAGGGVVKLVGTTIVINGTVSANGSGGTNSCGGVAGASGGGAGGGVRIVADTLSGSGTISANGFDGSNQNGGCSGGGGGGGRVLVSANINGYTGTVTSSAGNVSVGIGGLALAGHVGSAPIAPGVPYNLFSNASSAQTTSTNPINLSTTTPFFSAIYTDTETGDTAVLAQIQVSTSSSFSTITHWDSGSSGTSITACAINSRCQDLKYNNFGTAPIQSLALNDDADENSQTKYYWRVRYFDSFGATGIYSTSTAYFTLLDAPNEPSGMSISSITSTTAALSWSDNSGVETGYVVQLSTTTDDGFFATVTTTAANSTGFTTSSLTPDTRYRYRVAATNSVATSSFSTSSAFYTLAAVAGTPTTSAASASSISITLDNNGNPASTTYAIYNATTNSYVAADGSASSVGVYQATSTWGTNFSITGLTANTGYQFSVVARNQSGVDSATSTASTIVYTYASVPSSVSASVVTGARTITVSWSANGNAAGTSYQVDGVSNSLSSGVITATSYQFTGLTEGTTYSFHVRAINTNNLATAYSDTVSVTIAASGGVPPNGGNNPPPSVPEPDTGPFGGDDLPDVPLDDFMPTGLIKIVSPLSGEIDLMKEADISGPYVVTQFGNGKSVPGTNEIIKLQKPFRLDYSFDVRNSPYAPEVIERKELFSKGGDYYFGFFGAQGTSEIANNGFCFVTNDSADRVCDDSFDRKVFAPNKRFDYTVSWNGEVLSLLEGDKKLASKNVSSIKSSDAPLVLGGKTYLNANNQVRYLTYPSTIYKMQLKSEPILIYTNKPEVKLKIDATYAPELALKESDGGPASEFSNITYNSVTSEMLWNLSGADGKKCINARFRSALKKFTYDTYACAILDTVAPPAKFIVDTGYDTKGVKTGNARVSGKSETDVAVTIYLERFFDTAGVAANDPYGVHIAPVVRLAAMVPEARLAASAKTQFSVNANKDGTWQYNFTGPMEKGARYIISVQTRDLAGNISIVETQDFVVGTLPKPCDPTKETCEPSPCDPNKEKCEPLPCDPIKEKCEPLPCDPAKEQCEPLKPEDTPKDEPLQPNNKPPKSDTNNSNNENGNNSGTGSGSLLPTSSESNANLDTNTDLFENILNSVAELYTQVRNFVNDPRVQAINQKVAVPLAATLAMVNAAIGFQLPYLINLLRYLFGQPMMLWRRRKQKTWGVVYNSYTKEPVDLATIRLVDAVSGRVLTSQVTDFHGRYFLMANTGQFKLEVIKPGFSGFSEYLKEKDEDTNFTNLYHGAAFYAPRDQFEINYNIPLDPIVENKPVGRILRDNLWEKINYGFSFAGMAASIMSFVVTPRLYTFGFVCLHVGLFALFYRFAHHKLPPVWGVVREFGTKNAIGRVVVRVFDSAYNKLVNTAVTDKNGRYAILVGPSVYYLSYEKAGYAKKLSPVLDYSSKKTGGMGGIINRDEMLEKAKPGAVPVGEADPIIPAVPPPIKSKKELPKSDLDIVNEDIKKWKEHNF